MDFKKSNLNQKNKIHQVIKSITKFISSIVDSNQIKININYDRNKIIKLKSICLFIDSYFTEMDKIIDCIYIEKIEIYYN